MVQKRSKLGLNTGCSRIIKHFARLWQRRDRYGTVRKVFINTDRPELNRVFDSFRGIPSKSQLRKHRSMNYNRPPDRNPWETWHGQQKALKIDRSALPEQEHQVEDSCDNPSSGMRFEFNERGVEAGRNACEYSLNKRGRWMMFDDLLKVLDERKTADSEFRGSEKLETVKESISPENNGTNKEKSTLNQRAIASKAKRFRVRHQAVETETENPIETRKSEQSNQAASPNESIPMDDNSSSKSKHRSKGLSSSDFRIRGTLYRPQRLSWGYYEGSNFWGTRPRMYENIEAVCDSHAVNCLGTRITGRRYATYRILEQLELNPKLHPNRKRHVAYIRSPNQVSDGTLEQEQDNENQSADDPHKVQTTTSAKTRSVTKLSHHNQHLSYSGVQRKNRVQEETKLIRKQNSKSSAETKVKSPNQSELKKLITVDYDIVRGRPLRASGFKKIRRNSSPYYTYERKDPETWFRHQNNETTNRYILSKQTLHENHALGKSLLSASIHQNRASKIQVCPASEFYYLQSATSATQTKLLQSAEQQAKLAEVERACSSSASASICVHESSSSSSGVSVSESGSASLNDCVHVHEQGRGQRLAHDKVNDPEDSTRDSSDDLLDSSSESDTDEIRFSSRATWVDLSELVTQNLLSVSLKSKRKSKMLSRSSRKKVARTDSSVESYPENRTIPSISELNVVGTEFQRIAIIEAGSGSLTPSTSSVANSNSGESSQNSVTAQQSKPEISEQDVDEAIKQAFLSMKIRVKLSTIEPQSLAKAARLEGLGYSESKTGPRRFVFAVQDAYLVCTPAAYTCCDNQKRAYGPLNSTQDVEVDIILSLQLKSKASTVSITSSKVPNSNTIVEDLPNFAKGILVSARHQEPLEILGMRTLTSECQNAMCVETNTKSKASKRTQVLEQSKGWQCKVLDLSSGNALFKESATSENCELKGKVQNPATSSASTSAQSIPESEFVLINECCICFEPCSIENSAETDSSIQLQPCSHVFCSRCFMYYLLLATRNQSSGRVECPVPKCQTQIDAATLATFLSYDKFAQLRARDIELENARSGTVVRCPFVRCGTVLQMSVPLGNTSNGNTSEGTSTTQTSTEDGPVRNLTCPRCNTQFCSSCSKTAHWPASCQSVKRFLQQIAQRKDDEVPQVVVEHVYQAQVKRCPSCKEHIEKTTGCDHMRCGRCREQFCWRCLGNWGQHMDGSIQCYKDGQVPLTVVEIGSSSSATPGKMINEELYKKALHWKRMQLLVGYSFDQIISGFRNLENNQGNQITSVPGYLGIKSMLLDAIALVIEAFHQLQCHFVSLFALGKRELEFKLRRSAHQISALECIARRLLYHAECLMFQIPDQTREKPKHKGPKQTGRKSQAPEKNQQKGRKGHAPAKDPQKGHKSQAQEIGEMTRFRSVAEAYLLPKVQITTSSDANTIAKGTRIEGTLISLKMQLKGRKFIRARDLLLLASSDSHLSRASQDSVTSSSTKSGPVSFNVSNGSETISNIIMEQLKCPSYLYRYSSFREKLANRRTRLCEAYTRVVKLKEHCEENLLDVINLY